MAEELRGGDDDGTHYAFSVAEAIFVGWFTFEYIVRFIAAPQKFRYNLNRTPCVYSNPSDNMISYNMISHNMVFQFGSKKFL